MPPELQANINADIERAGGWYIWRDLCLMENLTYNQSFERKMIKQRLTSHLRKSRHRMNLNRAADLLY